jgi:hypothetical protein
VAYTLAQAAQATGVNRSTILRAIMSGRISGTKDDTGTWYVEPVELRRVFPPAQAEAHQSALEDAELRMRLSLAEERLCELKQEVVRWREQADAWQRQAEASQKQPTDQREHKLEPMSWWRWLRSTG